MIEHYTSFSAVMRELSYVCMLLSVVGLIYPKAILWWADKKQQTRSNAFGYAWAYAFVCIVAPALFDHGISLFSLIIAGLIGHAMSKYHKRLMPSTATTFDVQSLTSDTRYRLDPVHTTCTCPDWTQRRMYTQEGSPCRVCKHLARYYAENYNEIPATLVTYHQIFSYCKDKQRGLPYENSHVWYGTIDGMAAIISADMAYWPWVNIMSGHQRYGLNIDERRWSYGVVPPHWQGIVAIVRDLCDVQWDDDNPGYEDPSAEFEFSSDPEDDMHFEFSSEQPHPTKSP